MLDIEVPHALWDWASVRTTSSGAEQTCAGTDASFDGWDPARAVLGLPGDTPAASLAACTAIPVEEALRTRGALLVNSAGRVGVCIGRGVVVQPAGREYAVAETTAAWWVAGYHPGTVRRTLVDVGRGPTIRSYATRRGVARSEYAWSAVVAGGTTGAGVGRGEVTFAAATAVGATKNGITVTAAHAAVGRVGVRSGAALAATATFRAQSEGLKATAALTASGKVGKVTGGAVATTANRTASGVVTIQPSTGLWASGVSMQGQDIPAFAAWRGTPVTSVTTWSDNTPDNALNCYQFSMTDGMYYDWTGDADWACGAIWASPSQGAVSTWASAAAGNSDVFWAQMLTNVKAAWNRIPRGRFTIRFAHEMNGNWFDWSVAPGQQADFIAAWRRFYGLKQSIFPQARLAMCPNGDSSWAYNWSTSIYPGAAYVDLHSVDWYSNHWEACGSAINTATDGSGGPFGLEAHRRFALAQGKALSIGEWAVNNENSDSPAYIQQMHDFFAANAGPGAGQFLFENYYNIDTFAVWPNSYSHPNAAARYQQVF